MDDFDWLDSLDRSEKFDAEALKAFSILELVDMEVSYGDEWKDRSAASVRKEIERRLGFHPEELEFEDVSLLKDELREFEKHGDKDAAAVVRRELQRRSKKA